MKLAMNNYYQKSRTGELLQRERKIQFVTCLLALYLSAVALDYYCNRLSGPAPFVPQFLVFDICGQGINAQG